MKIKIIIKLKKCYIFGESHFHRDEVDDIRKKIIKIKPDIILHELWWEDKEFYKKYNIECVPLEDEPKKDEDFQTREVEMLANLKNALQKYNKICVVVGDTHLRTITTEELEEASIFARWCRKNNCEIIRSKYKEIQ